MKNTFLNIMAAITALCMLTITVFVILTAGVLKNNSDRTLSKIADIEEQVSSITSKFDGEGQEESSDAPAVPVTQDSVSAEDAQALSDAAQALSEAASELQEQSESMASVDYATLNEAIERLNTTSVSLEETASRIAAIFG